MSVVKKLKHLRQKEVATERKNKRKNRLLKHTLWYLVIGYKDIREYIYNLIGDPDIIVIIESMRTAFEPKIKKMIAYEMQRKERKYTNRKARKELKKKWKTMQVSK